MPVYSPDNSFESDFSKIERPAEFESYQDKGTFKNFFESASSDYKEKTTLKKSNVMQVREKVEDSTGNRNKAVKVKEKNQFHKNDKLISLKKGKVVKSDYGSKKNRKKISGSKDLLNGSQILILAGKKTGIKKSTLSDLDNLAEPEGEIQNTNVHSLGKLDSVKNGKVVLGTDAVILKSNIFQITDTVKSKVGFKKMDSEKKTSGSKKSDSNKISKSKLSVLDLRSADARSANLIKKIKTSDFTSQKNQSDFLDQSHVDNQDSSKPIVIELTHIKDNFSGESKTLTTSSDSALMKQLEESINSKIVKQSSVILKDSGAGEIKLILKPEQLGKVRIKLNMHDNRISGNIIVDNASVKEIFENNLQNLEKAFRENGFDTAALNVSVGGDHSGSRSREKSNDIIKQIELIDESVPTVYSESDKLIDLVV